MRWDTKRYILGHDYPHSFKKMKLWFPVHMQLPVWILHVLHSHTSYQRDLEQLAKQKVCLWYVDKGSTENQNIEKLSTPWNNPKTAQTEKKNS